MVPRSRRRLVRLSVTARGSRPESSRRAMPIRNPFRSTTDSRSAFHREISPQTARATAKTSRRPPRAGGPLRYEGGGAQLGRNSLRPRALLDKKTVGGKQPYAIALADRRLLGRDL